MYGALYTLTPEGWFHRGPEGRTLVTGAEMKQLFGIDDPKLELRLLRSATTRARSEKRRVLSALVYGCTGGFTSLVIGFLHIGTSYYRYVLFLVAMFGMSKVLQIIYKRVDSNALRSTLREAGRCEECGYDLTNTGADTCPECGHDKN